MKLLNALTLHVSMRIPEQTKERDMSPEFQDYEMIQINFVAPG